MINARLPVLRAFVLGPELCEARRVLVVHGLLLCRGRALALGPLRLLKLGPLPTPVPKRPPARLEVLSGLDIRGLAVLLQLPLPRPSLLPRRPALCERLTASS